MNGLRKEVNAASSYDAFCRWQEARFSALLAQGVVSSRVLIKKQRVIGRLNPVATKPSKHDRWGVACLEARVTEQVCREFFNSMLNLIGDLFDDALAEKEVLGAFWVWCEGGPAAPGIGLADALPQVANLQGWQSLQSEPFRLPAEQMLVLPLLYRPEQEQLRDAFLQTVLAPALRRCGWVIVTSKHENQSLT